MTRQEALALIDMHKNALVDPVEMLHWTWLRMIIVHLTDDAWDTALKGAEKILST